MLEIFFSDGAIWFGIPALLGTGLFALKLLLLILGGDHGGETIGEGAVGDVHADSSGAFTVFSVQGLITFAMGFGWAGLAALHFTDWGHLGVLSTAIAGGMLAAWLMLTAMRAMFELQSSGNISIDSCVGLQGTVYVGVPASGAGRGQVQLVVDGKQRIFNAVTTGGELPTGTRVSVVGANNDNTISVSALGNA